MAAGHHPRASPSSSPASGSPCSATACPTCSPRSGGSDDDRQRIRRRGRAPAARACGDLQHRTCVGAGGRDRVSIVEDVSFDVDPGQRLGIVGESGSGKSLTLRAIAGLLPRAVEVLSGRVEYDGLDLLAMPAKKRRALMGPEIAMIFQEPMTALNPVVRVGDQIAEGPRRHLGLSAKEAGELAVAMMARTGIPDPARRARAYPHELSGGLRQRIMIAMAVSCGPRLLLCDEPTTALDVTVQLQVLKLLEKLCDDTGTVAGLRHPRPGGGQPDLQRAGGHVRRAHRRGRPGQGHLPPAAAPLHPGPAGVGAGLRPARTGSWSPIPGFPPNVADRPPGCPFAPRCGYVRAALHGGGAAAGARSLPGRLAACFESDRLVEVLA